VPPARPVPGDAVGPDVLGHVTGPATERHRHSRRERTREPSLCAAHPMNATMSE
jgi:hypothetical protein